MTFNLHFRSFCSIEPNLFQFICSLLNFNSVYLMGPAEESLSPWLRISLFTMILAGQKPVLLAAFVPTWIGSSVLVLPRDVGALLNKAGDPEDDIAAVGFGVME